MKFELAKFTDVTAFANKVNKEYLKAGYKQIFLCEDIKNFIIARLLEGFGEDYEAKDGSWILEIEMIDKECRSDELTVSKAQEILENDTFENWDYEVFASKEEAVKKVDSGFGINA